MPKKPTRKAHLPRRDDLPFLKVSAIRKAGIINPAMSQAEIEVGGLKRIVGLWHMLFPNKGSWSYFICPTCSRKCQTLRLYDGRMVCRKCDGLMCHAQSGVKAPRIEQLRSLLAKPNLEHYGRLKPELALRKAIIAERRKRLEGWPPKT